MEEENNESKGRKHQGESIKINLREIQAWMNIALQPTLTNI